MKERNTEWSTSYKGVRLNKYRSYFKSPEDAVTKIDDILSEHPRYLIDRANMHRALTQRKGPGKSYRSGDHPDKLLSGTFGIRRLNRRVKKMNKLV
jgi:hypothetical protein